MSNQADVTIVGAGVVGLAVAARLAGPGRTVYVLERNEGFGLETSSRNSGVIHAGIYYPEGSLKARLCVQGNGMLHDLCQKNGIGHRKLGKLIVATCDEEVADIVQLLERGTRNGARELALLSAAEVRKMEPGVESCGAVWSPSTGILDAYGLVRYFAGKAQEGGAQIAYRTEPVEIGRRPGGYEVKVRDGSGLFSFFTRVLINCAGLGCQKVSELAGVDSGKAGYRIRYAKGEYFSVPPRRAASVGRLVYPVPPRKVTGAGIHVTLDLEGRMRLGPNTVYVDNIDYAVDEGHKRAFYESVKRWLPALEYDDLEPEMAGIRPTLQAPGGETMDFVIRDEIDRGLPGFINLIGIESPGLTASPAIAECVYGLATRALAG